MEIMLEKETLLLQAYNAICKGEYDKANALTNLANAVPKKIKSTDDTDEIFNSTFKEFCNSGIGIIKENDKAKFIDPKVLLEFFSKTGLKKKDILNRLRKSGVKIDNVFTKDKNLKTIRAYSIKK